MSHSTPIRTPAKIAQAFLALDAAAERVRVFAEDVYRCDTFATPGGRWGRAPVACHARRKGELLAALDQACGQGLKAAHMAGLAWDDAERRILDLAGACVTLLAWAWARRGRGAWHNRQAGEEEHDYLERIAWRICSDHGERELMVRTECLRLGRDASLRLGVLAVNRGEQSENRQPRGTIQQRMLEQLAKDPQSIAWSQRQWATWLGCAISSVAQAPAWDTITKARALTKAERVDRPRGRS
jgi:hypothetical protein